MSNFFVKRNLTKFFGLVTTVLVIIYFTAKWFLESNPGAVWLIPEDYVAISAIITAIITAVCYMRKI